MTTERTDDATTADTMHDPPPKAGTQWGRIGVGVALVLVIALVILDSFTTKYVLRTAQDFLNWLRGAGAVGPLLFAGVYMLATVLFIPGSLLTLGAGFVFSQVFGELLGIVIGSLAVFVGATVGSILCFLLGRYVLRHFVEEKSQRYKVITAVDKAMHGQGFKMVLLLRLSPIIPFNAFNYIMGITSVSLRDYTAGSVGMIPGTIAYVYLGSLFSSVTNAATGSGDTQHAALRWSLFSIGIVATIAAVVLITVYARRALKQALDTDDRASLIANAQGETTTQV